MQDLNEMVKWKGNIVLSRVKWRSSNQYHLNLLSIISKDPQDFQHIGDEAQYDVLKVSIYFFRQITPKQAPRKQKKIAGNDLTSQISKEYSIEH